MRLLPMHVSGIPGGVGVRPTPALIKRLPLTVSLTVSIVVAPLVAFIWGPVGERQRAAVSPLSSILRHYCCHAYEGTGQMRGGGALPRDERSQTTTEGRPRGPGGPALAVCSCAFSAACRRRHSADPTLPDARQVYAGRDPPPLPSDIDAPPVPTWPRRQRAPESRLSHPCPSSPSNRYTSSQRQPTSPQLPPLPWSAFLPPAGGRRHLRPRRQSRRLSSGGRPSPPTPCRPRERPSRRSETASTVEVRGRPSPRRLRPQRPDGSRRPDGRRRG